MVFGGYRNESAARSKPPAMISALNAISQVTASAQSNASVRAQIVPDVNLTAVISPKKKIAALKGGTRQTEGLDRKSVV